MKSIDIICLGRAAVDFYGQQIGSSLENMGSFAKYLGGSSANIAYGCSKLGLNSAMLTRVGDEHMGRFVRNELESVGVDISHVITDKERLTGLVVLGIQDKETFPLIFYRKDCADMAISENDFTKEFIASSRSLLITGTHFSSDSTYQTSMKAIEYAKASDTQVIVDIDYRPVLWGLTELGDGESRFVASNDVSQHLQTILPHCDVIVGTEEEIHIAGGSEDTIVALTKIRQLSNSIIVLKLGPLGCTVITSEIPDSANDFNVIKGNQVDILNVLGAGDAFMSGFLRGYLRGESLEKSANYANASGALVVSRHGCAPAIPGEKELLYYIENAADIPNPSVDLTLNHLHRVSFRSKEEQEIFGFAFDHRKQLLDLSEKYEVDSKQINKLKNLFVKSTQKAIDKLNIPEKNIGVLIDDTYGEDALNSIAEKPWWIGRPVELPGSRPLKFEGEQSIGSKIQSWPLTHTVKCLFFYHLDEAHELKIKQEQKIKELYHACLQSGHQLLLEVIPPSEFEDDEDTIPNIIKRFYDIEIKPDWWKLPSLKDNSWKQVSSIINTHDPYCQGVLLLGLSAPIDNVIESFGVAAKYNICRGFTVGRTIFYEPTELWMQKKINDDELVDSVSKNYIELIEAWKKYRGEIQ
jgi:5-dehydro-2-deoxygluconokinase